MKFILKRWMVKFDKDDIEDWNKLSKEKKEGIENAILEIDSGKGIQHAKVMMKFRKKYLNA